MGIGRSTFYDMPDARARDLTIVTEMKTICDEFEAYGYRRVDAELRHRGIVVNAKKIRRLMRLPPRWAAASASSPLAYSPTEATVADGGARGATPELIHTKHRVDRRRRERLTALVEMSTRCKL